MSADSVLEYYVLPVNDQQSTLSSAWGLHFVLDVSQTNSKLTI